MPYNDIASVLPYYDDFDKTKNYLAMLFNPGRNVQARELTQIQSTLQNQVTSFANHIFRDNSIVVNANLSHTSEYHVLTIANGAGAGEYSLDAANMVAQLAGNPTITGTDSHAVATVTHIDQDNFKIYYKSTSGGDFTANEIITTSGLSADAGIGTVAIDAVPQYTITGKSFALLASCDSGILYHGGRFVIVNPQSIIVDYKTTGHYHIGFQTVETVTTIGADSTLGDPAAGFNNATSAGADRYTVTLKLTAWEEGGTGVGTIATLPHVPADDYAILNAEPTDYVEYMVIKNSTIIKSTDKVNYAEILDLLARRTYDESGNYTITDFPLTIEDHASDTSLLTLNLQPGKSYVEGFEIEKQQTTSLDILKARTEYADNGVKTLAEFGQYVEIGYDDFANTNDSSGFLFSASTAEVVNFYASADTGFNTVLASARIVHMIRFGENLRLYLTEIVNSGGIASAGLIRSVATPANTANLKLTNGIAVLDGTATPPIINFGYDVIKSFDANNTEYSFTKLYTLTISNTGTATITADSYTSFESGAVLSIQTPAQGWDINDAAFSISIPGGAITIQRAFTGDWSDGGTVQILVRALKSGFAFRTKTVTQVTERVWIHNANHTFTSKLFPCDPIAATNETLAVANKTGNEDGVRLISVTQPVLGGDQLQKNINLESTALELESNPGLTSGQLLTLFDAAFATGQTDYFYDEVYFSNLDIPTLKQNWGVGTTDTYYDVTYEYYTHDSAGSSARAFSPTSYPADRFDSVPYYQNAKKSAFYDLNRCLDFRLKKSELASNLAEFPMPGTRITTDIIYYLSRIDKVYLTVTGELGITYGISSLNPVPPDDIDGAMTMYVLEMPAYTYTKENVTSTQIDNRRYTMRDIGKLERRLEALEEYSALSLLEKSATDMLVLDANGYDKFKSGLFVDTFSSYSTQDISHPEHRLIIDQSSGQGKTPITHEFFDLGASLLTNVSENANTYTLDYSEKIMASNDKASGSVNVNPFLFFRWNGTVKLSPSVDNWMDVNYAPAIRDARNIEKLIYVKPYVPPVPTVEAIPVPPAKVPETPPPVLPGLPSPPPPIIATPLPEVMAEIIPKIWIGIKEPMIITKPIVTPPKVIISGGKNIGNSSGGIVGYGTGGGGGMQRFRQMWKMK